MLAANVKNIVFSSTCATYGVPETVPIQEDAPQHPISPYGTSKLMVEYILKDFCRAYGLNFVAFRYFNAAGADAEGKLGEDHNPETHLIPLVLQTALGVRDSISIFGTDYPTPDGTCIRDYIHVTDLANVHILGVEYLLNGGRSEIFNLGNNNGFSVREIIEVAKQVTGRDIKVIEQERRDGDPPALVGSSEKVKQILGWTPQYANIHDIISHAWQWHQKRHGKRHGT
jgi:UDP-glucose 4-epimerase